MATKRIQILTPDQRKRKSLLQKAKRLNDPLGYRNNNLLSRYGITHEHYLNRLKANGGKCEICYSDSPRSSAVDTFAIDHDHTTKQVRGILCHPCNWALGYLKDNPLLFRRAAAYLEDSSIGCWEDLPWLAV